LRVTRVKKARKYQGNCGRCREPLRVGDPYVWWAFRYGGKRKRCVKPGCYPKASDLTDNSKLVLLYGASEMINDADSSDADSAASTLKEAAEQIKEAAEEYRESATAIEEGFQHPTEQSEEMELSADHYDGEAERIEGIADEIEALDDEELEGEIEGYDKMDPDEKAAALEEKKEETVREKIDEAELEMQ
jgi:predicted RNase H-like HicB family nuclease